jgi:hypothetical protein
MVQVWLAIKTHQDRRDSWQLIETEEFWKPEETAEFLS